MPKFEEFDDRLGGVDGLIDDLTIVGETNAISFPQVEVREKEEEMVDVNQLNDFQEQFKAFLEVFKTNKLDRGVGNSFYEIESSLLKEGYACKNCIFFKHPEDASRFGSCEIVNGWINEHGICNLNIIPTRKLHTSVLESETHKNIYTTSSKTVLDDFSRYKFIFTLKVNIDGEDFRTSKQAFTGTQKELHNHVLQNIPLSFPDYEEVEIIVEEATNVVVNPKGSATSNIVLTMRQELATISKNYTDELVTPKETLTMLRRLKSKAEKSSDRTKLTNTITDIDNLIADITKSLRI